MHNNKDRQSRTLFATHYHELSVLEENLRKVVNLTVDVRERDEEVVFLRKVVDGICNKSYGIHVGKLAGLPDEVLNRANELMEIFELTTKGKEKSIENIDFGGNRSDEKRVLSNGSNIQDLINEISAINPDIMSPRDALDVIYKLKSMIEK